MWKSLFSGFSLAFCVVIYPAVARAALVENGQSPYTIIIEPAASNSEKHAADELQSHIKACTGAELPIANQPPAAGSPMIVLGCGPVAKSLGVDPAADQLGEQGYLIKTVPPHLVIAGTPAAGTLYGMYDFLENHLGVRWYAPGVTKTPAIKNLALPQLDSLVRPTFAWRHTSYSRPGADADFFAHQRENNGNGGPDNPQGVQYAFDSRCHSYFRYISPGEFFDTHPEYFSEIGGVRRKNETQLCLTNPDVLEIVAERMLKRMADSPGVRQHNFSQMDWYNYCQCANCSAMNKKYGTLGGTQFWFVNQLAERTSKAYPEKLIGTLAYMYTEEAPKGLKMHPNAAVWLCHMYPSCDSHPVATCPLNADYKRRALDWSKRCSHLYIWHYIVDFAHYHNPFPNFDSMAADIRFYRDIRAEGIYLQGMSGGGGGGEFSLLRPYYGTKLLWNPDCDPDAVIRDFLDGYYGAAAEPIYQYVRMLHDKVRDDNIHMHLYTNPAQGYLPDDIVRQAAALFDQAEAAVNDDTELLERVRVARMPLVYARLFPRNGYTINDGKLTFNGEVAAASEAVQMLERMKRHGFTTIREHDGDPQQLLMIGMLMNTPVAVLSIGNEFLTVDVVPVLGGRALRITDRKTGQCVTASNVTKCLFFPFQGGEEIRRGSIFDLNTMFLPYVPVTRSDRSITLSAQDGPVTFERTLTLADDKPVLTVQARLINNSEKPAEVQLRSHLELDLGDLRQTRFEFKNRAGQLVQRQMPPIIENLREGEHFLDQNVPAGEWTFSGTKGLQVTQRFNEADADFTWVYAFPEELNDLEVELWRKTVTVAPGAFAELTHELEITPAE
ncbi:MAG TPA: DUF4838 domain-containing protein [Candidatus Bathyarchaeia archaeon]|nr:DUF4838 domain-containing protein [Candidatus Bathyarchaeia archaeon]